MSPRYKAHIGLLFTNIFFAANLSTIKHLTSNEFVNPFGINILRVSITVILLWTLYLMKPSTWKINKEDVPRFLICALAGIAVNQILFVKGVSLTFSIHAALLTLITPILISFIAAWLLKERFTFSKAMGLGLGISGAVILISGRSNSGSGENILLGDILIICNAISYTFYMVLVKPLMKKYQPLHVVRWIFTFGFVMILPFCLTDFLAIEWNDWGWFEYTSLAIIVIGGTFLAYLFNIYGIKVLGASVAGSYIYLQPVFATIISMIFLKEPLSLNQALAALLIFAGVYLANKQTTNA